MILLLFCVAARAQVISVDGSSTVYPISLAVAEEYFILHPDARITVAFSGTGGGFERLCRGAIEVNDASRPIEEAEATLCRKNDIAFIELPVAQDAVTVAVSAKNDFVRCLSIAELKRMFKPDSSVRTWSDVRSEWPDETIRFFTPGTDSGTFDTFTHAVVGTAGASRTDIFPSEDDNVLVEGIAASPYAIGYFGYAYYLENTGRLRAVAIDSGKGCVPPSARTVASGAYGALARPLFIYVSAPAASANPRLGGFVRFYLSPASRELVAETGYLPLAPDIYRLTTRRFERRVTGSAFSDFAPGDSIREALSEGLD